MVTECHTGMYNRKLVTFDSNIGKDIDVGTRIFDCLSDD